MTSAGLDWDREKWRGSVASKFIRGGEKNAVKYADEIIVLSKDVQKYFLETYGRETHFIPNGVNRPEVREAKLITDHFGLEKDSYILFLGRLVPEKGIRYLVEAFKNVKTDKKLVIAGGSSDTDSFMDKFTKIFVPYLTTAYGQPEKSLISCGFTRLDLFTSTCFCLSLCVKANVISGANGFWLRSILNPPQRKLIEQKTE